MTIDCIALLLIIIFIQASIHIEQNRIAYPIQYTVNVRYTRYSVSPQIIEYSHEREPGDVILRILHISARDKFEDTRNKLGRLRYIRRRGGGGGGGGVRHPSLQTRRQDVSFSFIGGP